MGVKLSEYIVIKFLVQILQDIVFFFFEFYFSKTASARGCFSAVPCHTLITIRPGLTAGWLHGAMARARVHFLLKETQLH